MKKDDALYLGHMLDMGRKVQQHVAGKDRAFFDQNELLWLGLTHLLQTIGEAARHVSDDFQDVHPSIPWKAIMSMRHRIVHDYLNVDEDVVWETATLRVPELIAELEKILPPEAKEPPA